MKTETLLLLLACVLVAFGLLVAYISAIRGRMDLLWLSFTAWGVAGACGAGRWHLTRGAVDWDRIAAEQRLWESGPLGKAWLRLRTRVLDRLR